jgi:hypothetical protein
VLGIFVRFIYGSFFAERADVRRIDGRLKGKGELLETGQCSVLRVLTA